MTLRIFIAEPTAGRRAARATALCLRGGVVPARGRVSA